MKQFEVLVLIVLGLVVLGLGGYALLADRDHDPGIEIERPIATSDGAEPSSVDDDPRSPADGPRPAGPNAKDPRKSSRPPRPAPRTIEDITIPVRIERGDDSTVVRGCVLRPSGDPLPSAIIELMRVERTTILQTGERVRVAEPVISDAKGCFEFRGFRGGRGYLVRVEHGSYAPFEFADIEAPEKSETVLPDLRVAPGGSIVGTVTRSGGVPIEGARILAYARGGNVGFDPKLPVKQVLTDARGDFTLTNLAFCGYSLTIEAAEMRTHRTPVVEVTTVAPPIRRDVRLEPGKRIRGKVIDADKQPIAGVVVEAYVRTTGGPPEARGQTDEKGTFELDGLGPEELRLTASKTGYSPGSLVPVSPDTEELVVLRLTAHVSITGFVVEKESSKPITSFGLMLWTIGKGDTLSEPIGGLRTVERSADGSFTIEDVAPGEYRVQAFANDFAPTFSPTFRVKRTFVYGVTIELERGASLAGRVVDAEGKPLPGAVVRMFDNAYTKLPISQLLYGEFTELKKPVTADSDGRFLFENLAAGRVQIRASATGRMPLVRKDIDVAASGTTELGDLVLGHGGTVRGMVFDANGTAVRGSRVSLRAPSGEAESTKTNGDGEFEFRNVPPGDYTLGAEPVASSASSNFFSDAIAAAKSTQSVTVFDEQITRVDIHLVRIQ